LYSYWPGGATGVEASANFAAFDTGETSEADAQINNMADLAITDTTLVFR